MTIRTATRLYTAALREAEAADASGDAVRIQAALLALGQARQALDTARPGTSLDLTAYLPAAE